MRMGTKEAAAELRKRFKARGWNARKVSVRTDYYSMGSSIYVTVRCASVSLAEVERIAEDAESIRRCEMTGDILSGGNRYVSVRESDERREVLARRHYDALVRALDSLRESGSKSRIAPVSEYCGVQLESDTTGYLWSINGAPGNRGMMFWPQGEAALMDAAVSIAHMDPDQRKGGGNA